MNVRRWWFGPLLLLALALAAVLAVWAALSRPAPPRETVAAHDAVVQIVEAWPDVEGLALAERLTRVTVASSDGTVHVLRGEAFRTDADAYAAGAGAWGIAVGGERVATAYILDTSEMARRDAAAAARWAAIGGIAAVTGAAWLIAWHQHRTIIRPFRRLEGFAADVARGDLDTPLPMDRTNSFGAFSEAFDLMRAELAAARQREEDANENARKLVAELSHDIRTPVASIAAAAELLAVRTGEENTRDSASAILGKTTQIESLVADLVQANEVAIEALPLNIGEWPASELRELVRSCDMTGALQADAFPECLVAYDPLRMRQVVDNLLVNASKYAGTGVEVEAAVAEEFLMLAFRDFGPGVPEEELDAILWRRVRGTNVGDAPGEGLGLYTSSKLMGRMGGSLRCHAANPGLQVVIEVPLAR